MNYMVTSVSSCPINNNLVFSFPIVLLLIISAKPNKCSFTFFLIQNHSNCFDEERMRNVCCYRWDSMNTCYLIFKAYFETLSKIGYLVIKQFNIISWFMSIAQISHYEPDQNSSSFIITWGIWIFPWLFHSIWATVRSL